jgi:hypothetical protein
MPMLVPPVLPTGINLAVAKWAKGEGPRLLRFGSESVLAPLVPVYLKPTCALRLQVWRDELAEFPEREPLLQWLEDGFPSLSACAPVSFLARNHGSFEAHRSDSMKHLREEVEAGRIIDCGTSIPCWPIRINPLGSVEKKGTFARRRISDMSFPAHHSVNDGIDCSQLPALRYASVQDVADILRVHHAAGGGPMFMAKVDLEAAYRQFPLRPADRWQFGYFVDGRYYLDTRLPFGLSTAPSHFSRITRAICWLMRRAGYTCIGYLDDFLMIEATRERTEAAVAFLLALLERLGLPVSQRKLAAEGTPANHMIFLGILVDADKLELRLDNSRLSSIRAELAIWLGRRSATIRQIASLVGVLAFAARVIGPGRLYMSRLIQALRSGRRGPIRYDRQIGLSAEFLADLAWWSAVMPDWNGVSILSPVAPSTDPRYVIHVDASDWGYGGWCSTGYFYGPWPSDFWRSVPIHLREMAAMVLAVLAFGSDWPGVHVVLSFFSDNDAVVHTLSNGFARVDPRLNALMRMLHLLQTRHSFAFATRHIAGLRNVAADALSRNNVSLFLVTVAPLCPVQVHPDLSMFDSLWTKCQ